MKSIFSKDLLNFFKTNGIDYICEANLIKEYTIASLYSPVNEGFYFLLGESIPDSISNSAFLLKQGNPVTLKNGNIGIYINQDPQLIYYELLSLFFKSESTGEISNSVILHPEAKIGKNVQIDHFSIIGKAVIGDNAIIQSHCYIHDNSIIGKNVIIENQSVIGAQGVAWVWNEKENRKIIQPQLGGVEIKENCFLGANTIVVRGSLSENSVIGKNTLLAPGCRIGHGTQIGDFVHFANNIVTGGNTKIGNNCFVGSAAVFRPKVNIHDDTIIGAGSVVVKNTTEKGKTLIGVPAIESNTKEHPQGMPKPKSMNT